MALTLAEAAKLSNDVVLQGVIETVVKESRVLDVLPFVEVGGRTVRRLLKLQVYSVDLVQSPAGVGTGIAELKACACGCGQTPEACPAGLGQSVEERAELLMMKAASAGRASSLDDLKAIRTAFYASALEPDAKSLVPGWFVRLAEQAAERAANELGILPPAVKWFVPPAGLKSRGYTYQDGEIWLSTQIDTPLALVEVVAHEVKHQTQAKGMWEASAEHEATNYARWFLYHNYGELLLAEAR